MTSNNNDVLIIRNARILFPNFSGKAGQYNREGDRSFCVVIDNPDDAANMTNEGWNVKMLAPRDADEAPTYYIQVKVSYKYSGMKPRIVLHSKSSYTLVTEETVKNLDDADLTNIKLAISPSRWSTNGKTGISAYLKTMHANLVEDDEFADEYPDMQADNNAVDDYPREDDVPF